MFVTRGYHAVTLEQIADEAGASQGVVSRFASKADMFLALLADRITERAVQNASAAGQLAGSGLSAALLELGWQAERATQAGGCWSPSSGCMRPGIPNSAAATRLPMQAPSMGWPAPWHLSLYGTARLLRFRRGRS